MRCWISALLIALAMGELAFGQSTITPPARTIAAEDIPPLNLAPVEPVANPLPPGTVVSQPLQEGSTVPESGGSTPRIEPPRGPLGKSWHTADALFYWTKGQRMPPLLTASPFGVPILNSPDTVLLLGGRRTGTDTTVGGRFTIGWSLDPEQRAGIEIGYFFTGTQTLAERVGPSGGFLARPIIAPFTGAEDAVLVNSPWMPGAFSSSLNSRMTGWTVTGLTSLHDGETVKVAGLAGYRYFLLNEGLRLEQSSEFRGFGATYRSTSVDQFDAHNRFHGGEVGLRTEWNLGQFSFQFDTRVALGKTVEVVRIGGLTVGSGDGLAAAAQFQSGGGVLAQPSNSGRFTQSKFAVLPEGGLKLGYRFGERARISLAYNVIYLSSVVRPGDQIDRGVQLFQTANTGSAFAGGDRPAPVFDTSDYWVQGLTLGLEWRY